MQLPLGILVVCLTGRALGQCQPQADTNDNTCKNYYECYNNQYYLTSCPDGQIFYPGLNKCVLQSSYDCVCNSPSCVRPDCTGNENSDIADRNSCSNYIYCNGRYPLRRACPSGNIFNPDQRSCEPRSSSSYRCPNDPFQCPQANGEFADLRDRNCQTYYTCSNYQATKRTCDNDYHYYEMLKRCVLPDSYDCQEKDPFVCPEPDKDFADPKNRNRYYYCMGNAPLHRTCPAGQVFNADPKVRRCT